MNIRIAPVVSVFCALCLGVAFGQAPTPSPAVSDQVNGKIAKIDLLLKICPLLLKKDQYPPLLDAIDQAHALEKDEEDREDKILADMMPSLDEAIKNGVDRGVWPSREFQDGIKTKLQEMANKQVIVGRNMTQIIFNAIKPKFNAGQLSWMAKAFGDEFVGVPKTMSDEDKNQVKTMFFIKNVFLDPHCHDLLQDMSKNAS